MQKIIQIRLTAEELKQLLKDQLAPSKSEVLGWSCNQTEGLFLEVREETDAIH